MPLRIEPPLYRRRVDFYTKSRAFDTTRARTELGYVPKVDLEEGLARTIAWYREQGCCDHCPADWTGYGLQAAGYRPEKDLLQAL